MNITLDDLIESSLSKFSSESDLLKSIEIVSSNFVFERDKIAQYRDSEKLVSAYYQFYFPTNVLKLEEFFKRLDQSIVADISSMDFVDFGCGPGTFGSGLLNLFPDYQNTIYEVDISNLMLLQAKKSQEYFFKGKDIKYLQNYKQIDSKELVLFFGNSANEMGAKFIEQVIEYLNPKHIIFMEPGTKHVFHLLGDLREKLINSGFNSIYPCSSNKPCPLKGSEDDWCHQFFKVGYDVSIERISQLLKKDRRNLPVISHLYSRSDLSKKRPIIIRSYAATKVGREFEVCVDENKINKIQFLYRKLSKKEQKCLNNALAGEQISYDIEKEIEENFYRVVKSL